MSVGDRGLPKFLYLGVPCTLTAQGWALWLLNSGGHVFVVLGRNPSVPFWGLQVYAWLVAVGVSGSVGPSLQYWQ